MNSFMVLFILATAQFSLAAKYCDLNYEVGKEYGYRVQNSYVLRSPYSEDKAASLTAANLTIDSKFNILCI